MNIFTRSMLALVAGATPFFAQAQQGRAAQPTPATLTPGRSCGTMGHLDALLAADPSLAQRMAAIEKQTQEAIANPALNRTTATVIIPVVVHVVYSTTAQNISDAQVRSQIDVLNEDFRKLNADRSLIPSAFSALAADVNVQFVLAKRTPAGAATTGIVRKATTVASFSDNNAVKKATTGGDNAWDATKYLNLWACNLGNNLLGYAQFPGGAVSTDGVVILFSAFGRVGTVNAPYNKGRTATHEVGHWLNLRHIWGDAKCGSDLVSDTPTQETSNGGCPAFPHRTCGNTTNGDLFMNYMDYTNDACMYMFSTGQSTRMNALFGSGGARAGLVTSLGGTAPRSMNPITTADLYPNPATEVLHLNLSSAAAAPSAVAVLDLSGHAMPQARYNGQADVQLSGLPKGLYLLRVTSADGVKTLRFEKE